MRSKPNWIDPAEALCYLKLAPITLNSSRWAQLAHLIYNSISIFQLSHHFPVGSILGFTVQPGAVALVNDVVLIVVGPVYVPFTTTGIIPPVCNLHSRCPILAKIAVTVPPCAVILMYVPRSFSQIESKTPWSRIVCCAEVSWYIGPHNSSVSRKPGSKLKVGYVLWR